MLVSFPLLASRQAVARAIAASGVSDHDDGPEFLPSRQQADRPFAWRTPEPTGNPYVTTPARCPECGTGVVRAGGCLGCPACGWGKCG